MSVRGPHDSVPAVDRAVRDAVSRMRAPTQEQPATGLNDIALLLGEQIALSREVLNRLDLIARLLKDIATKPAGGWR